MGDLTKFAKGTISAPDLTVTGDLIPAQAQKFISAIKDNTPFFKKITYQTMYSLEQAVDVLNIAKRVLTRVAEGQRPPDGVLVEASNAGPILRALKQQLFAFVGRDAILNNAKRRNYENELFHGFTGRFGSELVLLGWEGIADDYDISNPNFTHLNKGWIQVARDHADTNKDTYATNETYINRLKKLVSNLDDDAKNVGTTILMSKSDREALRLEIGEKGSDAALFTNGKVVAFLEYPIESPAYFPNGIYMATPLSNLVFGIVTKIFREREYDATRRGISYIFDAYADYQIAFAKWVSLLEPAT